MGTARLRQGSRTGKRWAAPWNSALGTWQDAIKSTGLGNSFTKGQTPSLSQEKKTQRGERNAEVDLREDEGFDFVAVSGNVL